MTHENALAEWILAQAADALIFADRAGRIVRWNDASTRLFGFTPEEALGERLDLIIPPYLRDAHWAGFDAAMESGELRLEGRPTLTRALHRDGGKRYVEMTFALVRDPQRAVVGSVAMARDVTARVLKEKEQAARAAGQNAGGPAA